MTELESGFRLSDLTGLIRRRIKILVAAGLIGLVLGFVAYTTSPAKFSATSRVQVQPVITDPLATTSSDKEIIDVATEQDLVKSDGVASTAAKKLGLQIENRSLLQRVTVTSKEDSLVLEITYVTADPEGARAGANAFADAYLAQRRTYAEAEKARSLRLTKAKIDFTRKSLDEARAADDPDAIAEFQSSLNDLNQTYNATDNLNTDGVGRVVRRAPEPQKTLSKAAVGKGVGVFGLCLLAGLGVALLVDRSDALGGGRRRVQQILPSANIRMMPRVINAKATQAEVDAAVDRLAIELSSGSRRGSPTAVVMVSTLAEPPVPLARDIASSLAYAGIPSLFVVAGHTTEEMAEARVVSSFADLLDGEGLAQPELPEDVGRTVVSMDSRVTWLRPRGSAEASGLLRRSVVEALITRASRDGFEVVVFLAANPTRNAAAAALGQWVDKTVIVVDSDDGSAVVTTAEALAEADARVSEVVWT